MEIEESSTSETLSIAHFEKEWWSGTRLSERLWYYFGGTITTQIVWRVFRRLKDSDRKVECESDSDLRGDYMLTLKTESDNG